MKQSYSILILAFLLASALAGCTGKNQGGESSKNPAQPSIPTAGGTGDSGGGNLYKGKPLESYIKKPADLSAYKNLVQRVVDAAIPDIQFPMKAILETKAWYFVPGPLSALSSSQIGSVVPTEQAALQNFTQIWIDQDLFANMNETDQAKLLLHEILMGFKLLKFESPLVDCYDLNYGSTSAHRSKCESLPQGKQGKVSDLTPNDYDDIRQTASFLLEGDLSTLKQPLDWRSLFNQRNFHFGTMYYVHRDQFSETPYEEVLHATKLSLDNGYRPTYGFSMAELDKQLPNWRRGEQVPENSVWKSTSRCQIELEFKDAAYFLSLQIGNYQVQTQYAVPSKSDPMDWHNLSHASLYFWMNGEQLWQKELVPSISGLPSSQNTVNKRERQDRLIGYFDSHANLKMVAAKEEYTRYFANQPKEVTSQWTAYDDEILRGDYFLCALSPEIQFHRSPNAPAGNW